MFDQSKKVLTGIVNSVFDTLADHLSREAAQQGVSNCEACSISGVIGTQSSFTGKEISFLVDAGEKGTRLLDEKTGKPMFVSIHDKKFG